MITHPGYAIYIFDDYQDYCDKNWIPWIPPKKKYYITDFYESTSETEGKKRDENNRRSNKNRSPK